MFVLKTCWVPRMLGPKLIGYKKILAQKFCLKNLSSKNTLCPNKHKICAQMRQLNKGNQREKKVSKGKQRKTKVNKGKQSLGLLKSMKSARTFKHVKKFLFFEIS